MSKQAAQTTGADSSLERLYRVGELTQFHGYKDRFYVYKLIAQGLFPRPVKIGNISAWLESDLIKWQRARIAERDAKAAADTTETTSEK